MSRSTPEKTANTRPGAAELMSLIAERAPALIAAGVTSLSIDGFAVTLAPPPPVPANVPKPEESPRQHIDPLRDPSTYPGGRVPGFTREGEL